MVGDRLEIVQSGRPHDVAELEGFLAAITGEIARSNLRKAMFDNRATTAPGEALRERVWTWLAGSGLLAVAVVLESEMAAIRLNMDALGRRLPLRAFSVPTSARQWLAKQPVP